MKRTYLSFTVGDELYAVNVSRVLEVLEKQIIYGVPNAPEYVKGIINFRGDVVPVFETRDKFRLPSRDENDAYVIIVFDLSGEIEKFRIGTVVDKVKDVLEIDDAIIQPVPVMSKEFNSQFLYGICKMNDRFILLLDIEKVFSGEELQQVSEIDAYKEQSN